MRRVLTGTSLFVLLLLAATAAFSAWYLQAPSQYTRMGGAGELGPYSSYNEAANVNRLYFNGNGRIFEKGGGSGGSGGGLDTSSPEAMMIDVAGKFLNAFIVGMQEAEKSAAAQQQTQKALAAERRRQEAERLRAEQIRQEQERLQRVGQAARMRDAWDGQDQLRAEELDGAFDVPIRPRGTAFFGLGGDSGSAPPDLRDAPNDGSSATTLQVAAQTPPRTGEFTYTGDEKPRIFYPQYTAETIVDAAERKKIGQLLEKWRNEKAYMREDRLGELPSVEESRTRYADATDPRLRDKEPLAAIGPVVRKARDTGESVLDGVKYTLVGTLGKSSPLGRGFVEAVSDMREIWDGYGKSVIRSARGLLSTVESAVNEAAGLTGDQEQQDKLSRWLEGVKTQADDNVIDAAGQGVQKKFIRSNIPTETAATDVFDRF